MGQQSQDRNWMHQQPEHVLTSLVRTKLEHIIVFSLQIMVKYTTYHNVQWITNQIIGTQM